MLALPMCKMYQNVGAKGVLVAKGLLLGVETKQSVAFATNLYVIIDCWLKWIRNQHGVYKKCYLQ